MPQNNNPYSLGAVLSFISNNFAILVLVILFFLGGVVAGSMWTENQMLKGGSGSRAAAQPTGGDPAAPPAGPSGPTEAQLAAVPEVSDSDHVRGNADAKVVLVEYSDFECPFCQRFHPTMEQVMEEYGDDVAWVYRHFPLGFHPNAQRAAEASECVAKVAGDEGFWTYADAIFAKNAEMGGSITPAAIDEAVALATSDVAAVTECIESGEMADVVTDQMTAAQSAGVSGTPGTFIVVDGEAQELIPGALPFAQVQASIDSYL